MPFQIDSKLFIFISLEIWLVWLKICIEFYQNSRGDSNVRCRRSSRVIWIWARCWWWSRATGNTKWSRRDANCVGRTCKSRSPICCRDFQNWACAFLIRICVVVGRVYFRRPVFAFYYIYKIFFYYYYYCCYFVFFLFRLEIIFTALKYGSYHIKSPHNICERKLFTSKLNRVCPFNLQQ